MAHRCRLAPRAESLERRLVLNGAAGAATLHEGPGRTVPLSGMIQVQFATVPGTTTELVTGAGTVSPLGPVVATGSTRAGRTGEAGVVSLVHAADSLNLKVQIRPGGGRNGPKILFTVVGGTAVYAGATGQGGASWQALAQGPPQANPVLSLDVHGTVRIR